MELFESIPRMQCPVCGQDVQAIVWGEVSIPDYHLNKGEYCPGSEEDFEIEASQIEIEMTAWQRLGEVEYEYNAGGYTGRYRYVGGRKSDGNWPVFNQRK